ncbi:MAG: DUF4093 domain-containing protein [Oscillospiraceae bacterium]|nr:DUF4093 domain-containing protein [Oscillospiraceae bacterium]
MIKIKEAIVVEGKYDKIKLDSIVDTIIVDVAGFGIFKDREQLALLRLLAQKRGLIVLTDSDGAGAVIRNHLQSAVPPEQLKHAYCPLIAGKERRKDQPSKEGLLGVEGIPAPELVAALRRAGATFLDEDAPEPGGFRLTRTRLYEDGLSGGPDSAGRRQRILQKLGLPRYLSVNRLVEVLELTLDEDGYQALLKEIS